MEQTVTWETPPQAYARAQPMGHWRTRLLPLMEYPGRWAFVGIFTANMATELTRRKNYGIPPGDWEFLGRATEATPRGKKRLYARYLGPLDETTPLGNLSS